MHYKECILFKNDKWFNRFLNKTEKYSYFKKYDNKIDEVQKDTIEVKKAKIQANKRDVNARRIARATQNTSSETNDTFINIELKNNNTKFQSEFSFSKCTTIFI